MPNAPYDITTLTGQVRFHAADTSIVLAQDGLTVIDNSTFSDAEIAYALADAGNEPHIAAATLLDALAADRSRLAVHVKTLSTDTDMQTAAQDLRTMADRLRNLADVPLAVCSPDQVFVPSNSAQGVSGTMYNW